ncbi:MAG: DUF1080 domain-containing protein [Bryobacterales bacterium]|nr:DUF1080 domain-containing protein [Bryobacterales bacterium]
MRRRTFLAMAMPPAPFAAEAGYATLFNGHNLDGWTLAGRKGPGYLVESGMIVCPDGGGGNLFTQREFANFILRLEFRMAPGANNGIGIRAPLDGRISQTGMEIQLRDDSSPLYDHARAPAKYTGSIYEVVAAKQGFLKPAGEWNTIEITAGRRRILVVLNGHRVVTADLDAIKDPRILAHHPGLARPKGHIGFLGHTARVEFRSVRIRELP